VTSRHFANDSCPDSGLPEFHTTFDILAASIAKGKQLFVRRNAPKRLGPLIYVVDDEAVIATTLAAILAHSGYATRAFTDPLEALKASQNDPPELLLSDVMMPGMSGVDLALGIRGYFPECKVLLFSGAATTADLLQVARDDGHHFDLLTKPIHPSDLLYAIRGLA
jgi:CheY-like chemotaxis protein